jgi:hypothetical protein
MRVGMFRWQRADGSNSGSFATNAATNIKPAVITAFEESTRAAFDLCDMGPINPRSQNVPKTKVERAKLVEITKDGKKVLVAENID